MVVSGLSIHEKFEIEKNNKESEAFGFISGTYMHVVF